jgi:hypothetical protein
MQYEYVPNKGTRLPHTSASSTTITGNQPGNTLTASSGKPNEYARHANETSYDHGID